MGFLKSRSTSRAEKINAFQATVCEFGTPVPDIVGTVKIAPNVINWKDFYSQEKKTTQKSGKHKHTQIDYRYYVYLELAIGESIKNIGKIWAGSREYASLKEANESNGEGFPLILHTNGGKSAYMAEKYPDQAVDYKNLSYLCSRGGQWNGTYLGENNASVPSYSFEVLGKLLDKGDGVDVNPADYIMYLLERVGIYNGTDPEETIVDGIGRFREYCRETDLLISSKIDNTQRPVHEIVEDLCILLDVYFFWSNDRFKIVVKDDRKHGKWIPDKTVVFDLNNDDFLPQGNGASVIFARKNSTEIYNRFTLAFTNRTNHYEEESVSYEFPDDIRKRGLNQKSTIDGKWFYTRERAIKAVELAARKNKREQNKYKFVLDWAFAVLEPGDLVTLTDPACGLNKQIAMVESVTESADGVINVEALQYSDGEYSAAIIDPGKDNDNYFDYNIDPCDTAEPFMFQPPSAATYSGNELWIALKGVDHTWGGCNIYIGNQDQNYQLLNQHRQSASYGRLLSIMDETSDQFIADINGDFENATLNDAKNGDTFFYIDGECLSYQTCRKNSDGSWTFSGLIRGQYGTVAVAHSSGSMAVYCDGSIYVMELSKKDFGRRLYFRFPSINIFAANPQDISAVNSYSYLVQEYGVPSVTGINAFTRYTHTENAVSYSIQVEWIPPKIETYSQAQVWAKRSGGSWEFASYGYNSATIPNVEVGETYTIAIVSEDIYGVFADPDNSPQTQIKVVTKAITPNAPANAWLKLTDHVEVGWDFVINADVKYYEVRLDDSPGIINRNFVGRTNSNSMAIMNGISRAGIIYIYAFGVTGVYSSPCIFEYSSTTPIKPPPPELTPIVGGFSIRTLPVRSTYFENCYRIHIYIRNRETFYTENRTNQYSCPPGTYFVKYAFLDAFGEGIISEEATVTVKATIDPDLIESGSIGADKLDQASQNALTKAANGYSQLETDNAITNAFTKFEDEKLKSYSTITQMDDAIQLAVSKVDMNGDQILTKINLTDGVIKLDGKLTHVTGDTLIDNNVIARGQIQAGAVTANNLAAENIAMRGNLNISGGAVTLSEDGLNCALDNGDSVKFNGNGMSYVDQSGNVYSNISKMIVGVANHGQYVEFNADWGQTPQVICSPLVMQSAVAGYQQIDLETITRATNVTSKGFNVECFTRVKSGASGIVPVGRILIDKIYTDRRDPELDPSAGSGSPAKITKTYRVGKLPIGANKCKFTIDGELTNVCDHHYQGNNSHSVYNYSYSAIELVVKANGVEVARKLWRNPKQDKRTQETTSTILPINESFEINNVTSEAEIEVDSTAIFSAYSDGTSFPKIYDARVNVRLVSVEYNAQTEVVASTGSCTFMAVANTSIAYMVK